MQIAACYIRVSTEDQVEYSPDAQLSAIRDYANRNEMVLDENHIYKDEGISGRNADKRPSFQRMIKTAKTKPRPFDVILVHKFDRFSRNREDSIVYKSLLRKECGIQIISITEPLSDDKMSVLMESILEAMAEYYSLNLAEEVQKGKMEKVRRGEYSGRTPLGYKLEKGRLVIDAETSPIVRNIFDMFKTENCSKITEYLNNNQIKPRRGGKWYDSNIFYILQNPVYAGHIRYNYRYGNSARAIRPESEHIYVYNAHEPIISQELFDRTQERLRLFMYSQPKYYHKGVVRHWLHHILYCSKCGRMMTLNTTRGKPRFICTGVRSKNCQSRSVMGFLLEETVIETLKKDFNEMFSFKKLPEQPIKNSETELLKAELEKIENQLERAQSAYVAGIDTLQEYKKIKSALQGKKDLIEKSLLSAKTTKQDKISRNQFKSVLAILENPEFDQNKKNEGAKSIIDKITIDLETKDFKVFYR